MNCIWILLLLCCCGNRGTGNAGCQCGCCGNVAGGNTCGCCGHGHEHEHGHSGSCQGPAAVRPDNTCGPRCDCVAGAVTPPWQDDCPCDRVPPFRPEPRQSYPNISRGETCGCEEQ